MNIIQSEFRKSKKAKIKITSLDDLWHLSHIIDAGDIITSRTTRKIVGDKDVRKKQVSKSRFDIHFQCKNMFIARDPWLCNNQLALLRRTQHFPV